MKAGDLVFVISDRSGLEPGTRAQIVAVNGSSVWVAIDSPAQRPVLPLQAWDLLPARTYGCAVLQTVCETLRSLKARGGSLVLLTPEHLVRHLVEHGLSGPAARQCVALWDTPEEAAPPLPVGEWLQRIKRHYGQETILRPNEPSDPSPGV